MKEAIHFREVLGGYKVFKLVNRTDPRIGVILSQGQLDDLLIEAKRGKLTVTIT